MTAQPEGRMELTDAEILTLRQAATCLRKRGEHLAASLIDPANPSSEFFNERALLREDVLADSKRASLHGAVPREPTGEMVMAGERADKMALKFLDISTATVSDIWRAMYDAAAPDAVAAFSDFVVPTSEDAELCVKLRAQSARFGSPWELCLRATTRIESLAAQVAAKGELLAYHKQRADQAEASLATARADAERYRWLRQSGDGEGIEFRDHVGRWRAEGVSGSDLDAAIDAARSAPEGATP